MNGDNNHINYTAKDIEAYFSGKLSPLKMHAMEKDALDDPFLAEAMEGYEAMQGKSWKPQLVELQRHFAEERPVAKVIPINSTRNRWWKVAAAILIIGCGATVTYMLTNKKSGNSGQEQQIAKAEPKAPTTSPIVPVAPEKTTNPLIEDKKNASDQAQVQPVTTGNEFTKKETKAKDIVTVKPPNEYTPPKSDSRDFVYTAPTQQPSEKEKQKFTQATEENSKGRVGETNLISPPPGNNGANASANMNNVGNKFSEAVVASSSRSDDEMRKKAAQKPAQANKNEELSHSFIAQVVGPDNTPLPFANVNIKDENFGTYADVKGNFRLVSTDSTVKVEVRSVGYLPQTYTLRSDQSQNRIVLAEDENTARERAVVINDYDGSNRTIRRAGILKDSAFLNVEPADGWDNYNAYIANNIDIPGNAVKKDLHGEVELSFKVHPNGTISNITVSQSDCADCAELAKRLVEQGPQWKIKKGLRKSSGRIKVQF